MKSKHPDVMPKTKPFDPKSQEEIYFTMKVYATKSGGDLKTLKYSIDFHPPFGADKDSIQPFASPLVGKNLSVFKRIFNNVVNVFEYIADPIGYNPKEPTTDRIRLDEQKRLAAAIAASQGAISTITYEHASPPYLSVGTTLRTQGNGDMKPPKP